MRARSPREPAALAVRHGLLPLLAGAACLGAAYTWHLATYSPLPDFSQWPAGEARKAAFFSYLAPLLARENARVLAERKRLETIAARSTDAPLDWRDRRYLQRLADAYLVTADELDPAALVDELLRRVDAVPVSLGLAQAAKESGWGTSRFAVAGNALFGERCFRAGCGMVPRARRLGARHEVVTFDSPDAAVAAYVRNLNTHRDYEALRAQRAALRSAGQPVAGHALASSLTTYSERGAVYAREVQSLIRDNGLGPVTAE